MNDTPSPCESPEESAVDVAPDQLSKEALGALVESFILREGTDYGSSEVSFEEKKAQVMQLLRDGLVKISFDLVNETCTLLRVDDPANFVFGRASTSK